MKTVYYISYELWSSLLNNRVEKGLSPFIVDALSSAAYVGDGNVRVVVGGSRTATKTLAYRIGLIINDKDVKRAYEFSDPTANPITETFITQDVYAATHDNIEDFLEGSTPMSEIGDWRWYASSDGELYEVGPCFTYDEVLSKARELGIGYDYERADGDYSNIYVCQAVCVGDIDISEYFDFDDWLNETCENIDSDNDYEGCDDGLTEPLYKLDKTDIQNTIRDAIRKWSSGVKIVSQRFETTRNVTQVNINHNEVV